MKWMKKIIKKFIYQHKKSSEVVEKHLLYESQE